MLNALPSTDRPEAWISCHIFHNLSFERVIVELVHPLVASLHHQKLICRSFFIRYWDGGPHLRLRIQLSGRENPEDISAIIQNTATNYFQSLAEPKVTFRLEFPPYNRETDRYGGVQAMALSELQFADSSRVVVELLSKFRQHWDYKIALGLAMQMHILFAKATLHSTGKTIHFFNTFFQNWLSNSLKLEDHQSVSQEAVVNIIAHFDQSYTSQKDKINRLVQSSWENRQPGDWMRYWFQSCCRLHGAMQTIQASGALTPPAWFSPSVDSPVSLTNQAAWSIYESHIHMTNNRLGIYLRDEAFIAFLIVKGLLALPAVRMERSYTDARGG